VRATACLLAIVIAGCHPSATVERTMPVANLQSYRTVALRVQGSTYASQTQAMYLQEAVVDKLHRQCGFEQVGPVGGAPADVVLDLNITGAGRGGGGWIQNPALATLDALLVLSDGQSGELLGTARIHGKSSGAMVYGSNPENEAIDVVAKSVADLLAKSGCSGPRVARTEPPAPPPGTGSGSATGTGTTTGTGAGSSTTDGSGAPPDDGRRQQAEALNDQGKDKLRSADVAGALAAFQQANSLVPDARYEYNVCLAFEAQEQWASALGACKQARAMNPEPRLVTKIDHRIELLQQHP
jgi:hypothetical protein